jgi:hypothetical protein
MEAKIAPNAVLTAREIFLVSTVYSIYFLPLFQQVVVTPYATISGTLGSGRRHHIVRTTYMG